MPSIPTRWSAVVRLFGLGGPSAVVRRVGAIVVDAVNGVIGRRFRSHIAVERAKVQPFWRDRDSAPAVPFPCWVVRVQAPLAHSEPCLIFARATVAALTVYATCVSGSLALYAATAQGVAGAQVARKHDDVISAAVATADPPRLLVRSRVKSGHDESPGAGAYEIHDLHGHIVTASTITVTANPVTPPKVILRERMPTDSMVCAEYSTPSTMRHPNRSCVEASRVRLWILANGKPADECSE